VISQTNRIDDLGDVDMRNSRISHSTIHRLPFVECDVYRHHSLDSLAIGEHNTSGGGFDISSGCYAVTSVHHRIRRVALPAAVTRRCQFNDNGRLRDQRRPLFHNSLRLTVTNASPTIFLSPGRSDGADLPRARNRSIKFQYDAALGTICMCKWIRQGADPGRM